MQLSNKLYLWRSHGARNFTSRQKTSTRDAVLEINKNYITQHRWFTTEHVTKTSIYREKKKNSFTVKLILNNRRYIYMYTSLWCRIRQTATMLTTRMTCMIRSAISYRSRSDRQPILHSFIRQNKKHCINKTFLFVSGKTRNWILPTNSFIHDIDT